MKKHKYIYIHCLLVLIGLLSVSTTQAQNHRKKGDAAWDMGKYKTAVNNYGKVEGLKEDKKLLAKRGLGFFKLNMLDKAINHFTLAKKLDNKDPELYFLMAQAKHHLNKYEEAAFFYKSYVKEVGEKSAQAKIAMREMKNCTYAAFHGGDKATGFFQDFDKQVNTYYDEIYPMQSPRFGNIYYFTSNRNLKDMEVYSYEMDAKGGWKKNDAFGVGVNSSADEYVMDISTDGLSMLFVKANANVNTNKIFVSTFDKDEKQHIIALPDYLLGAMDLQIVDYNTIAFVSKDLGGEGGYDIYTIDYKNGIWSDPKNSGPQINTPYDERSPYYASNGEHLYFSSNKPYCYGGFDIYYYNTLSLSPQAVNLGKPVNSSGNDLQFRLNEDGQMAVMSSDRKTGAGAYDIYMVYMNDPKPMPAKDKRQLTYVRDYLQYINPDKDIAEEKVETHFEQLKDKLDKEETQKETEDKTKDVESSQVAVREPSGTATVELEPSVEKDKLANVSEATRRVLENKKKNTKEAPANTADNNKTSKGDEKDAVLDALAKYIETGKEEESRSTNEKDIEKTAKVEKEPAQEEATTKANKSRDEKDIEVPAKVDPLEDKSHDVAATTKSAPAKNTKSSKTTTQSNIPQPASNESPLASMKEKSKALSVLPQVKRISGKDINYAMLYQDRHDLNNETNGPKLKALMEELRKNKNHKVHIIAHTDYLEPGLPEFTQYNTLKRANYVAQYLMENSINKNRISIESVSANYPLVKGEVAGEVNIDYLAYNKRIDIEIRDESDNIIAAHNIDTKAVPEYAKDRKYELYSMIKDEVYYSIEIGQSDHIFKNAVLRLYSDLYIRKSSPTSVNKYFIGMFTRLEDADALQKELEVSSAPYAKLRAFYNGMPIKQSQMKTLSQEYPELAKFTVVKPN